MTSRSSLALIEDVNNKPGQHQVKNDAWAAHGIKVVRNKMPYGDYALAPALVVDTKKNIMELAMNVKGDHERFRNAAIKAMECGSHMVIVVENEDGITSLDDLKRWDEPTSSYRMRLAKNSRAKRYEGVTLAQACRTMEERYGLEFDFCTPEDAWSVVMRHLGVIV